MATAKKTTRKKAPAKKAAAKTSAKKPTAPRARTRKRTDEKLSQLDAAARVLAQAGEPMNCRAMIEAMAEAGLWSSPNGKTPAATLYASLLRHIAKHGRKARFKKSSPGHFTLR